MDEKSPPRAALSSSAAFNDAGISAEICTIRTSGMELVSGPKTEQPFDHIAVVVEGQNRIARRSGACFRNVDPFRLLARPTPGMLFRSRRRECRSRHYPELSINLYPHKPQCEAAGTLSDMGQHRQRK